MPQMANLTVKKNDGTTDIVYTAVAASAGDRSPAIWRSNTVGVAVAHRPTLKCVSRDNGDATGRRVELDFVYPSTVTGSDGKISVATKVPFKLSGLIPFDMPESDINEAVSQFLNCCAATLTKDTFKSGFAPT